MSVPVSELEARAASGSAADVDYLMALLERGDTFAECKKVDYALGRMWSAEGRERVRHFLFHGSQRQRNYAALFFKRRNADDLLDEAFARGCIDLQQAFSR